MSDKKQSGIHRITGPKQSEHISMSVLTEEQRIDAEFDVYMKKSLAKGRWQFALIMLGVAIGLLATAVVLHNFSNLVQTVLAPTVAKSLLKTGLL